MIWPVAALAVVLLGFVIAYGSALQGRLESAVRGSRDVAGEADRDATRG